ncbi:MAG: hypothetical protein KDC10_08655 [Calditrichaeota bacterium]|nr:hypothetical protein [Candidatus Cloacimonadota bacterium]MCA9787144.1 hypothetical protein [Candidatus Cloacimonadota bacterium]MCB1047260.1 hypothetical protein [Calditrichota bacterium]
MRSVSLSAVALLLLGTATASLAQSFEDLLQDIGDQSSEIRRAYFQPLVDASALLASSGTYHTGKSHGLAGFDVGLRMPLVLLTSGDQLGILSDTPVDVIGLPMLTANKGLVKGFQVGARLMKMQLNEDVGDVTLYGGSLRWEANEIFHIPFVMPRIALQANYSQFKLGESIDTKGMTWDLIVSKKLPLVEFYGGYSTGTLTGTFDYTFVPQEGVDGIGIHEELDGKVSRLNLGVNVTPLPTLKINGEYGMGDYNSMSLGLILSIL